MKTTMLATIVTDSYGSGGIDGLVYRFGTKQLPVIIAEHGRIP
jgi:hypothetical protein